MKGHNKLECNMAGVYTGEALFRCSTLG